MQLWTGPLEFITFNVDSKQAVTNTMLFFLSGLSSQALAFHAAHECAERVVQDKFLRCLDGKSLAENHTTQSQYAVVAGPVALTFFFFLTIIILHFTPISY